MTDCRGSSSFRAGSAQCKTESLATESHLAEGLGPRNGISGRGWDRQGPLWRTSETGTYATWGPQSPWELQRIIRASCHSSSSARQTGSHTCLTGLLRPPAHSQLLHHTCPLPALAPACPLPAPAPARPQPVPAPTCPQPAPVPACPPVLSHFYPTGSRSSTTFSTRPPILLADQPHL